MSIISKYTAIFKLKERLEDEGIPFVFLDCSKECNFSFPDKYVENLYRIKIPNEKFKFSIMQGYCSYGGEDDLLEIYSDILREEIEDDPIRGSLTVEQVMSIILDYWNNLEKMEEEN